MPSWVVPTVAAELWGVSIEHVLTEISAGRVRSRQVGGFTFVDVDANAESVEAEPPKATYRRSLAWALETAQPLVTAEERDALLDEEPAQVESEHSEDIAHDVALDDAQPDWEQVRARVSRQRRPPSGRSAA